MNFSIKNKLTLKTRIMMWVWYSYLKKIVVNPIAFKGMVFGASLVLFVQLVSVADIMMNLLQVQVGTVPAYVWQAITSAIVDGEFLKVVTLGIIIFSLLSLRFTFRPVVSHEFARSV